MDYPLIIISDVLLCRVCFRSFAVLAVALRVVYFASAAAPASRRARTTEYSVMPAATEAFSDSTMFDIGMPAMESHASRTRRLKPLPSEPSTTTSGSVSKPVSPTMGVTATVEADAVVSAFLQAFNGFGEIYHAATGMCAAAPADTFHAAAVTEAERRSGRITPLAPNAAAERMTAPRFCGSVTPSSAMNSGRAAMRALAELGRFHGAGLLVGAFHQLGE